MLKRQKEHLSDVMKRYTKICREVNEAHSMAAKDNNATFNNLSAKAETLLYQ